MRGQWDRNGGFGSRGVGKSNLVIRYVENCFVDKYDPTMEESFRTQISVDGEIYNLDILDTALGNETYSYDYYIHRSDAFILVFSITNRSSFDVIGDFFE